MATRELKFRAWDGETMHTPSNGEYVALFSGPGQVAWRLYSRDGTTICDSQYGGVLMQYTGLKDKNGKELYFDSDVVTIDRDDTGRKWMAVKDDFGIPCFLPVDGAFGVMLTFQDVFLGHITAKRNGFEIIGNIHQNPELIP